MEYVNDSFKSFLKTWDGAGDISEQFEQYLLSSSSATSKFGAALKSSLANIGILLAINLVITSITELAQVSEEVAQKAQELGNAFSESKTEIGDYKTKIEELHATINNSGSSLTDVTNARKELMSVQDQLIDKFGDEKGAIDLITAAINGQSSALDDLTQKQWIETKNNFNDEGFFNGIYNWMNNYDSNINQMIDKMTGAVARVETVFGLDGFSVDNAGNYSKNNELIQALEKAGYTYNLSSGGITLNGDDLEDVYNQLIDIQTIAEKYNAPTDFLQNITKKANETKETLNKYGNMYEQYMLYEEILPNDKYSSYFNKINDAYQEYQNAFVSGDKNSIDKAIDSYSATMNEALKNSDGRVKEYFEDMYPELQTIVAQWQFKIDFEANTKGLKGDVERHLETLGADDTSDILNFNYKDATTKEKEAYDALVAIAKEREIGIEELVAQMQQMGILKDGQYQALLDAGFTETQLKTLTDEELQIAYTIKNVEDKSFDELNAEIEKIKKESLKELTLVDFQTVSKSISTLSTAFQELSDNGYLTLDTISQIKEAVGNSIPNWDEYEKKLFSVQKGTDEYNQIMSDLTYATLENKLGGNQNLATSDETKISAILKENGVLNANKVAHDMIAKAKANVAAESMKNTSINKTVTDNLEQEANACGLTINQYKSLIAQEITFNNNSLNVSQKIAALRSLRGEAASTAASLSVLDIDTNKSKLTLAEEYGIQYRKKEKQVAKRDINGNLVKDKNGNKIMVDDYEYFYNGAWYDSLGNDVLVSMAYDEAMKSFGEYKITAPDYSGTDTTTQTKESFNWIETALSRIQRTITNLGKTVSATYKSWGERNSALAQQMSAVGQEISLQTDAYNKYMSLANSVSLSESYKSLVRTGAIRYDDESLDSNTAEKIREYQEFYEAALAASDAITDLEAEQANLIQTNFDNIAKRYDDQLSVIEHEANSLNSSIEMIEKQGHVVSEDLYHSLIQNANQQMSLLHTKYNELQSAMSGVAYGSEMWYSLNSQLLSIQEEMDSLTSSTIDWNNAIQDLKWKNFDRMLKDMAAVNSEADFLMELMSDEDMYNEDGSITDAGRATMGLHAVNYNSKMAQASEIAKELQSLDADYANDKENLTYLERRNELEEQYRDLILDAKDDHQALIDMQKDQYDALLDHMSELIDKRKDMLSQAKDAYDYEKTITEQAEEVAKLEKQLSAYQSDTSEESRATIQQLKVSLEDAKENLEETQYEKYISDQEQMLDALYDETEEWINTRLDDEALLLENILAAINENAGSIRDTLANTAYGVGTTLSGGISEYLIPTDVLSQTVELNTQFAEYRAALENVASQLQFNVPSLSTYATSLPANSSVNNITINGLSLDFPNVQTPEEWVTYLQHDKRFENIILEITDGNNSLSKYKW